jgi:hypothetical protein
MREDIRAHEDAANVLHHGIRLFPIVALNGAKLLKRKPNELLRNSG